MAKRARRPPQKTSAAESECSTGAGEWLHALDALLKRLHDLHPWEERETVRRLCKAFREGGCVAYQGWLTPGGAAAWLPPGAECPPTNPTPELERVALSAVISALNRIPAYAPAYTPPEQFPALTPDQLRELNEEALTPDQRHELEELRLRVIRLARDRLNALESEERDRPTCDFGPLGGDDWNKLPQLARKLLRYMRVREQADLEEVFPAVWEREYVAGKADVHGALNEANNFLAKRESKRTLHKRRGESEIYWA